jgi:RNA-binding protein
MIHNISYRTFIYGTENAEKVKTAIKTLFPKSSPQKEETEGYYKNPVLILTDKITKNKDIKNFIGRSQDLSDQILSNLDRKMDNKGNLFLRFDKQKAYQGELKIVEQGDSIHLKIKLAAYPAKREPALKLARQIWR